MGGASPRAGEARPVSVVYTEKQCRIIIVFTNYFRKLGGNTKIHKYQHLPPEVFIKYCVYECISKHCVYVYTKSIPVVYTENLEILKYLPKYAYIQFFTTLRYTRVTNIPKKLKYFLYIWSRSIH